MGAIVIGCLKCRDTGVRNGVQCQDCCPHSEHKHFMCIDCDKQLDPTDFYNEDDWRKER